MIIRRLLLCGKARNFVFAMFIWRLSIIFDLGLCVLIGQSELSTLCPVPGLLINSPGHEVGAGPITVFFTLTQDSNSEVPLTCSSKNELTDLSFLSFVFYLHKLMRSVLPPFK